MNDRGYKVLRHSFYLPFILAYSFFYLEKNLSSMSLPDSASRHVEVIEYPSSDGQPMADSTKQARWIITLYNNLRSLFQGQEVFVAADLLWYPVQGNPKLRQAPDVMLAFGRPDGDRTSYKQWEEASVTPQVVFEVVSPSNTPMEMFRKMAFYRRYGVEELIVIDPGKKEEDAESFLPHLLTQSDQATSDFEVVEWTSPRLGVRFRQEGQKVQVFYPDGSPFRSFEAIKRAWETEKQRAEAAEERAEAAEAELERLRKLMEGKD
jgi:Uma2 family endonuclease